MQFSFSRFPTRREKWTLRGVFVVSHSNKKQLKPKSVHSMVDVAANFRIKSPKLAKGAFSRAVSSGDVIASRDFEIKFNLKLRVDVLRSKQLHLKLQITLINFKIELTEICHYPVMIT